MNIKRVISYIAIGTSLFFFTACSGRGLGTTEKGVIGGAAIGSGLGAVVGHQHGRAGEGTAIGAGFGAITGGLIGSGMEEKEERDRRYY